MDVKMVSEKWTCKACGRERNDKPRKNEICGESGCTGRFVHQRQCKCGTWFVDAKYDKKYCSDACAGMKRTHERRGRLTIKCECCGREFARYAAAVKKKSYCSKECYDRARNETRQERVCEHCGRAFTVYTSAIEKTNASGRFCSLECYWNSMKKDRATYQGFRAAKRKHFAGKQFCAMCGTTKNIQIHHIIPNRLTQDQRKENLLPLCPLHHNRIERFTEKIHPLFEGDYETELAFLNNIFRSRQLTIAAMIKELQHG